MEGITTEAVVFDLFGTLVPEFDRDEFTETVRGMAECVGARLDAFEARWHETAIERQTGVFADIEENVRAICASLDVAVHDAALARAVALRSALYDGWFHPRDGAAETMRELKARGYRLALVSMCAPDAPARWRACDLARYVDAEVFSSETGLQKPHPSIYGAVCQSLRVEPRRCVYVGDGAYGELTGAAAFGMRAYLLRDPNVDRERQLIPDRDVAWRGEEIADLRDLLELLPGAAI
jgi:putative hydrolase of the HAD superfamily